MRARRTAGAAWTMLLSAIVAWPAVARAQAATAVPKLNLEQFTAPWYEMARLPDKREKKCVGDNLVLYGLRDKKNTFSVVISCLMKNDNWNYWDLAGKLSKDGSGRLELNRWWLLHSKYWVIAADSGMDWMLVGTPDHKSLAILSRTPEMAPDVMARLKAQASAQGFNAGKLIAVAHNGTRMNPEAGQKEQATPTARPAGQPGTENTPQAAGSTSAK